MKTTTANTTILLADLPKDMIFGAGHKWSLIFYRFVHSKTSTKFFLTKFRFPFRSILIALTAIGNIAVLVHLIKKRRQTPKLIDLLLTLLAITDLTVSLKK